MSQPPTGSRFVLEGVVVRHDGGGGAPINALDGVALAIEPGEAVALVGPSGSGKTTLLSLLNGSTRPSAGRILVDGSDLTELSPRQLRLVRASIGTVHQDLALVPNLRVSQNVLSGRLGRLGFLASVRTMLWPSAEDLRSAHALLERVGIPEKLFERTDRLSGGERQRVAIARALHQQPAALLADEPVSSVDPARARDAVGLLRELSRERGLTLVVSLHNLDLARSFFPRLIGLRGGRVAFDAPPAEVDEAAFEALYELADG